jgi:hypothetical protein
MRKSEEDTIYEHDIIRDPGNVKFWLAYIDFKVRHGSILEQAYVLERACMQLPRSYKLWKMVCCGESSLLDCELTPDSTSPCERDISKV